jgi:hypothetical protein
VWLEHAIYGIGGPDAQDPNSIEQCSAIHAEMKTDSVCLVWKLYDPATSFMWSRKRLSANRDEKTISPLPAVGKYSNHVHLMHVWQNDVYVTLRKHINHTIPCWSISFTRRSQLHKIKHFTLTSLPLALSCSCSLPNTAWNGLHWCNHIIGVHWPTLKGCCFPFLIENICGWKFRNLSRNQGGLLADRDHHKINRQLVVIYDQIPNHAVRFTIVASFLTSNC